MCAHNVCAIKDYVEEVNFKYTMSIFLLSEHHVSLAFFILKEWGGGVTTTSQSTIIPWTYYKWTLIVTLMNSCTCLCQKYHNDILNMPPRFDVMIVTVTFPGEKQGSALRNL